MNNKVYRNVGIALLIGSIIVLLRLYYPFILASFIWEDINSLFFELWDIYSPYEKIIAIFNQSIETIFELWTIIISIILIKTNKYIKQLYYLVYSFIIFQALLFILCVPLKRFLVINLIIAILLYIYLIHKDNKLSRIIKGKEI